MSRQAKISVLGLYEWDNTLFSLMSIPEGLTMDTVVSNILAETAELEVLYPNPEVMKNLIGVWSDKMISVWTKLYNTTQYEYNPIENYNKYEEGENESEGTSTHTRNLANTSEHYQAGFDSTADGLVKQDVDNGTNTGTVTNNAEQTASHSIHSHGNIGVTTTQKLIREEREVAEYNIYDRIITDFKERFCILVY